MSASPSFESPPRLSVASHVAQLARTASIELNVHDVDRLEGVRASLRPRMKIYISHLPKQRWEDTIAACRAVNAIGHIPIPHLPVRLIDDEAMLDRLLGALRSEGVGEALMISGDYARAAGPFTTVLEALHTNLLQRHGFKRVSFAGHPEGHPRVSLAEIRRAEIDKARFAEDAGLEATFVSQFCFEAAPVLEWSSMLASAGVKARLVAGMAGPAKLTTLVNFAVRCGVGRSIRALSARPNVLSMLTAEHGPEELITDIARALHAGMGGIDGLHVFGFGGLVKTCNWLKAMGQPKIASE